MHPHNSHLGQVAVVCVILSIAGGASGSCSADEAFSFGNDYVHWTCLPSGYLAPHVDDIEAFTAQARAASREELVALLRDANRFVAAHFALCIVTGVSPAPHPAIVRYDGYDGRVGPLVVRIHSVGEGLLLQEEVEYILRPQNLQSLELYWATRLAQLERDEPKRTPFFDELKYTSISNRIEKVQAGANSSGDDADYYLKLFAREMVPHVQGFHALRAKIEAIDLDAASWLLANDRLVLKQVMEDDDCFCRLHVTLSELLAPEAVAYLGDEVVLNGLTLSVDVNDHPHITFSFPNLNVERQSLRRFWLQQFDAKNH